MSGTTLVDAGPLVAFLNRGDAHHVWARAQLARLHPPLLPSVHPRTLASPFRPIRRVPFGERTALRPELNPAARAS